jgi:hypothetical protein
MVQQCFQVFIKKSKQKKVENKLNDNLVSIVSGD